MRFTGAQIIAHSLVKAGVPYALGIPGHGCWCLTDAFLDVKDKLQTLVVMHEQSADHVADGYFRATGRPLAAFTSIGPGSTNTIIGMATAFVDSSAVLRMTGSTHTHRRGHAVMQAAIPRRLCQRPAAHHAPRVQRDVERTARPGASRPPDGRAGGRRYSMVLNNSGFISIKGGQTHNFGRTTVVDFQKKDGSLYAPNFCETAHAFGLHGQRITAPDEVQPAVKRALATKGPALIEVIVNHNPARGVTSTGWWDMPVPTYLPERRTTYERERDEEKIG